jgi:adhesin HecA-like repeat protein
VRLRGVRIVERLDLTGRELKCLLELDHCFVDEEISLDDARATSVKLVACHAPKGITAHALKTRGDLALRKLVSTHVVLENAHIGGRLDLTGTTLTRRSERALDADGLRVDRSMICRGFTVLGEVHMPRAQIGGVLNLDGARLSNRSGDAVRADRLRVEHGMFCRNGFRTNGEVRLPRAYVGGQLSLRGAKLRNPSGRALYAHGLRVDQNMVCTPSSGEKKIPFSVKGELRLLGVHVGGQLDFSGAILDNSAGPALSADRLQVDQDVFCRGRFTARGEVSLQGAHISGQLDFSGARLTAHSGGLALNAGGLQVDQSMFCARHREPRAVREPRARTHRRPRTADDGERFRATGEVSLLGARIGGQLDFSGATLDNPDGPALSSDSLQVDQDMFCREQFAARGEVSLQGAHIGGQLDFSGATLDNSDGLALSADGLRVDQGMFCEERGGDSFTAAGKVCLPRALIGGQLVWLPDGDRAGHLSLYRASVGSLVDSKDSWPPPSELNIEHFVYDGFGPDSPAEAKDRIRWLKLQQGFKSQPYQQLIGVYRAHGQDADARKVAIAREVARRKRGKPGILGWLRSVVLGWTIRYGYTPALAAVYLIAVYALGVCIFSSAADRGAFIPVRAQRPVAQATAPPTARPADPAPSAGECRQEYRYPCFNPWGYGVDVVVPLLNVHQAEYWQPDATEPSGAWARRYGWIATALGWAFTTLAVAGFTGLVRRD